MKRLHFGFQGLPGKFGFGILVGLLALAGQYLRADSLTLDPGSLVILSSNTAGYFIQGSVYQESTTGTPEGSVVLPLLGDLAETITVLNGQFYVGDGAQRVNQIDPSTDSLVNYFFTPGRALVGNYQGNLLVVPLFNGASAIDVYSTTGTQLQSAPLQTIPAGFYPQGVTSDGTAIYLTDENSGNIYKYSSSGVLLGSFSTGLASLFGISYDAANNSLWTGDFYTGIAYDFSTSGVLLSEFNTGVTELPGFSDLSGIAYVPGVDTPEPGSWMLAWVGFGFAGIVGLCRMRDLDRKLSVNRT